MNEKLTIYFTRHGKTDTNALGLLVGQSGDPRLTEEGIAMALTLGRRLAHEGITLDAAYSSPFTRAMDTTAYVLQGMAEASDSPAAGGAAAASADILLPDPASPSAPLPQITPIYDLRDTSWGKAEGMTGREMAETFHITDFRQSFGDIEDPDYVSPMESENLYQFYHRFDGAVSEILAMEKPGRTILVTAHSSMGTWFGKRFMGSGGAGVDNCSLTKVSYDYGTGEFTLDFFNDRSHFASKEES